MSQWTRSWYASQSKFDDRFFGLNISPVSFENQTVRMVVHPHVYGSMWRLTFSNRYGIYPLTLDNVTLASQRKGQTIEDPVASVTFKGKSRVVIPVGEEVHSDPITLNAKPNADLTISLFTPIYTKVSTWHFTPARSTYIAEGNETRSNDAALFNTTIHSYYWLTALDVMTTKADAPKLFVVMGDSIAEGYASSLNGNKRWPDILKNRVSQIDPKLQICILNAGLTGNMLLRDAKDIEHGATLGLANAGERMLDRLDRDGLSQLGINGLIFHGGINDIFGDATAEQLIKGMEEVANRAKQKQVKTAISTITPFGGSAFFTDKREEVRQKVNHWIRSNTAFDRIIDLDQTLADPKKTSQLLHTYAAVDKSHPNDDGNNAIAQTIPLSFLF